MIINLRNLHEMSIWPVYLKYCSQQFLIVRDNQSIFKDMSECQLTLRLPLLTDLFTYFKCENI